MLYVKMASSMEQILNEFSSLITTHEDYDMYLHWEFTCQDQISHKPEKCVLLKKVKVESNVIN